MKKTTTFSTPFLRSLWTRNTIIFRLRRYFRIKRTDIDNQYDVYSRTCADVLSMHEGVYFTVSYPPVAVIRSFFIIISIASSEDHFWLTLQKDSIQVYHIYIWNDTKKNSKYPLTSKYQKELRIQAIKSIQGTKPARTCWYELIKSIFVIVKMIIIYYDHEWHPHGNI